MSRTVNKKPVVYGLLFIGVLVGIVFGSKYLYEHTSVLSKVAATSESAVPAPVSLPAAQEITKATPETIGNVTLPGTELAPVTGPEVRVGVMKWNTNRGLILACGGARTKVGSLMAKYNINAEVRNVDNCADSAEMFAKMAEDYYAALQNGGGEPKAGLHFVVYMGDAGSAFAQGFKNRLKGLTLKDPDFKAEIIAILGKSMGEDQCGAPLAWRTNPQNARGGIVKCVKLDGDCDVIFNWANNNRRSGEGICVNPDESTYDPKCLNMDYPGGDFKSTVLEFNAGTKKTRLVLSGPDKGKKLDFAANAWCSWTPADYDAFHGPKAEGMVSLVSTKDYPEQMPAVIFGLKKWDDNHQELVLNFLRASFEAADQIDALPEALRRAGKAAAEVWGETGSYWDKYYIGEIKRDREGNEIYHIGGSSVSSLAANLVEFGLVGHNARPVYQDVYEQFGNMLVKLYPVDLPTYPAYGEVVNTKYLKILQAEAKNLNLDRVATKYSNEPVADERVVSTAVMGETGGDAITFATGSSTLTPASKATVIALAKRARVTGLKIRIVGHTDDVGWNTKPGRDRNMALSEARAKSVMHAMQAYAPDSFPDRRFDPKGLGFTQPAAFGVTAADRAQNRRVEISFARDVATAGLE